MLDTYVHTCTYVITYVCMYVFVTLLAIADYNCNTLWMEVHDTYTPVMQKSAVIFEIGN